MALLLFLHADPCTEIAASRPSSGDVDLGKMHATSCRLAYEDAGLGAIGALREHSKMIPCCCRRRTDADDEAPTGPDTPRSIDTRGYLSERY